MLPENHTAIVARNETWTGQPRPSLTRRAGPARRSSSCARSRRPRAGWTGPRRDLARRHALGPEGTEIALPSEKNAVTFARIAHFGTWLRLAAELPDKSSNTVLVTLHLKS